MILHAAYLYNGEKEHLHKSLQYTNKVADKVHVFCQKKFIEEVSSFSEEFNVVFHEVEWNQSFSEVRNHAINRVCEELTIRDWILMIDSDECLDPDNCWKINSYLDTYGNDETVNAFRVNIVNNSRYWLSKYNSESKNERKLKSKDIRIFRASPHMSYQGRINESLAINPTLVCDLDISIYHHAYRYTREESDFLSFRRKNITNWIHLREEEMELYKKEEEKFVENISKKLISLGDKKKPLIGFFCLHYEPPIGGAEISMHNYFRELKEYYDIEVFCFLKNDGKKFTKNETVERDGITIEKTSKDVGEAVSTFIRDKNPDIITTQLLSSEVVVDLAHRNNIPCIYFAHSLFEDVCQHYLMRSCPENNLSTCKFNSNCPNGNRHMILNEKYTRCESIICNSHFTADIFKRFFPSVVNKIDIVCPNFNYNLFYPPENRKKTNKILAVNTMILKGRNVVINLALSNPDKHFIYVDSKPNDLRGIPLPKNMEFVKRISREEMAKLYREVDAVIYPTLMSETFGGVPCEAVLSGTPVVCPNQGNLENIVSNGRTGIVVYDSYDTGKWNMALNEALSMNFQDEDRIKLSNSVNINNNINILKKKIDTLIKNSDNNRMLAVKDIESNDYMFNKTEENKKILFLAKFFSPPLGGGEYFLLSVLKHLKKLGYNCKAACYSNGRTNPPQQFDVDEETEWQGIPVLRAKVRSGFDIEEIIKREKPDLVITQSNDALTIIKAAKKHGAKTICGTHFWRNICHALEPDSYTNMLSRSMSSVKILSQFHPVFHISDAVYVNSKFMQLGVEKFVGKKIENIIHPILDTERIAVKEEPTKKYVTMINPDYYKGGQVFVTLAKKMPQTNFLCLGLAPDPEHIRENASINSNIHMYHNIKLIKNTDDMASIYRDTSVLIVPSIVDETFCMVALEAMWNGIPVIGAPNGNIPYVIDGAGILLDHSDTNSWCEVLNMLLNDEEYYNNVSNQCRQKALEFAPEIELDKFKEMVEECIGAPNYE